MSKQTIIGGVVILILIGGFAWWQRAEAPSATQTGDELVGLGDASSPQTGTPVKGGTETVDTQGNHASAVTITYTDKGFSPDPVTVSVGQTVTWVNQSSHPMWVASNIHPTHALYAGNTLLQHCPDTNGTAFDQCTVGNTYSFTFDKVGSWRYHNHTYAADGGTITVTQ